MRFCGQFFHQLETKAINKIIPKTQSRRALNGLYIRAEILLDIDDGELYYIAARYMVL
jgi:hypothetical protein